MSRNYLSGLARAASLSAAFLIGGCQPFVPVVDTSKEPASDVASAANVAIHLAGSPAPRTKQSLGNVTTYSCRHVLWDPPPTREDAIKQMKLKAFRMGADAVLDVTFEERGTDAFGTNCWATIKASGNAVRIR